MEIKILGMGCPKCNRLENLAREVVDELDVDATFAHIKDMDVIMEYDVINTPALVIDEEIKASGRLPRKEEITAWIQAALD